MADKAADGAEACPVDHKTRAAWLENSRKQQQQQAQEVSRTPPMPMAAAAATTAQSCDSSIMDQSVSTPPNTSMFSFPSIRRLATDREISSIPRAISPTDHPGPAAPSTAAPAVAANSEQETGSSTSGHWIYPSERMFFDALRRKNYDANMEDMRAIVPLHNAVNEKAWQEILAWEKGRGGDSCGGPRLESFSGLSTQLTPKARLNTLLGYQAPFDRHDWVVNRCGTRVDYVIDFYSGRDEGKPGKPLNFYLDVRPKLNTWEGWRMRMGKIVGL